MRKRAGGEVGTYYMTACVILVFKRLKADRTERRNRQVLEVSVLVEEFHIVRQVVVQAAKQICLSERRTESTGKTRQRVIRTNGYRRSQILFGALCVDEEEQFVLLDGSPKVSAKLAALERCRRPGEAGGDRAVAE